MKKDTQKNIGERLKAEGWHMEQNRVFKPLLGRHWCVMAVHHGSGKRHTVEAATLKIAFKKLNQAIFGKAESRFQRDKT